MREVDIEELGKKFQECMKREFTEPTEQDVKLLKPFIVEILTSSRILTDKELIILKRKYKYSGKRSFLFQVYLKLLETNEVTTEYEEEIRETLKINPCKSWSGITSITVFTAAHPEYVNEHGERVKQSFSCAYNCHYCPNQPGQPRSYIDLEPGVLRANRNDFDCVRQMWDRMKALYMTGHGNLGKLEVLVLGGTWTSYPVQYREQFCRDIYYAANTFWDKEKRDRGTLDIEKQLNQIAKSRVIGLTLETRPDTINPHELKLLRYYGCTRIQLGIQHVDDDVLRKINRQCPTEKTVQAIELLKSNGYKIDGHLMPNLPGTTPEKDRRMLLDVVAGLKSHVKREVKGTVHWEYYDLRHPEFSLDQLKIYPCAITPWTEIEKWYRAGTFVQYPEYDLVDIMIDFKSTIFPWIRNNRIVRDIPTSCIISSSDNSNMRQQLQDIMMNEGKQCMCIRCREVKNRVWDGKYIMVVREYNGSNGTEYFISAESEDNLVLYGFVRLRLDSAKDKVFEELNGCALIRELHVYGKLQNANTKGTHVQHQGLGKTLMKTAEDMARDRGYNKISVIAGEGVKLYYDKIGYRECMKDGRFMIKQLRI
jgi:ELP3 family radical SAM enzyme/protein acetyltransferase